MLELGVRNITPAARERTTSISPESFHERTSVVSTESRSSIPRIASATVVVWDSDKDCLCSSFLGGLTVPRDGHVALIAYFAAPPADVTSMDVVLAKQGAFAAVPVS